MSPVQIVVVFAVGALVIWVFGGIIFRLGGWVFMVAGAAGLMLRPSFAGVGVLGLGCVMWLVGHWHYALRNGGYKSPLAARIFGLSRPADTAGTTDDGAHGGGTI